MRPFVSLSLALLLALPACGPTSVAPGRPGGNGTKPARPTVTQPAVGQGLTRRIDTGIARELIGKVKLISDQGGALISDQGGAVVSPESGRIVSNNSGNMFGKTKFYGLRQASRVKEDLLAEAVIEVLDAAGRTLLDRNGKPITATSDAEGRYKLQATLPDENVILRVKLHPKLASEGGELRALVASKGAGGPAALDLDTSASLAAAYVLDEYVKEQQAVLDRLPARENTLLRNEVEQARALLPVEKPTYRPGDLARLVGKLRTQAPALDTQLERIKAILLVGQANLGSGLKAVEVPLALPVAVGRDAAGNTYIAESVAGRIRKISPDGTIKVLAGDVLTGTPKEGAKAADVTFETISDMLVEPDGGIIVVETGANRVVRIKPDGVLQMVAGTGTGGKAGVGGPANQAQLSSPNAVCRGADGTLYLTEDGIGGRLLAIKPDGTLEVLPQVAQGTLLGVVETPDKALWVTTGGAKGQVYRRAPGATAFTPVARPLNTGYDARLLPAPGNGVYVTESGGDRLLTIATDGTVKKLTGPGNPGENRDETTATQSLEAERRQLRRPRGMAALPDGRLLVVDSAHMLVRVFDPSKPEAEMPTFAGSTGVLTVGAAQAIAVNGPAGLAISPDGKRLVFAEAGGAVVKQLENGAISILAGGRTAPWKDGGPALDAELLAPVAQAFDRKGNLWIAESANSRILKVTPDGNMYHMAGSGKSLDLSAKEVEVFDPAGKAAREVKLGRPIALAIGPDDAPYWVDQAFQVVCRLTGDGRIEVVAGKTPANAVDAGGDEGDGGPATKARLNFPTGLAFDSRGAMYLADALNFKLRKVTIQDPTPTITTFGGLGILGTLGAVAGGGDRPTEGQPLAGQPIVGPIALFIDAKDRLYVAEAGTTRLGSLLRSQGSSFQLPPGLPPVPARIRRIDLTVAGNPVTTIAGPGGRVLSDSRGEQTLGLPTGLLIDPAGRLVVSDGLNNQIKLVPSAALD